MRGAGERSETEGLILSLDSLGKYGTMMIGTNQI